MGRGAEAQKARVEVEAMGRGTMGKKSRIAEEALRHWQRSKATDWLKNTESEI